MGSLDGVQSTESGWIGPHEVVTVTFDPELVSYPALLGHAKEHGCTNRVWATTDSQLGAAREALGDIAVPLGETAIRPAKASDQLYYLRNSPLRFLPLTPLQARRVNGAMYLRKEPKAWLSPRQLELLKGIEAALSKDATALEGLQRPEGLGELDEYSAKLMERLRT